LSRFIQKPKFYDANDVVVAVADDDDDDDDEDDIKI